MVVQQLIGRSAAPPDPVRPPPISSGPKLSHAVAARGLFVELQSWKSSEYFLLVIFLLRDKELTKLLGIPVANVRILFTTLFSRSRQLTSSNNTNIHLQSWPRTNGPIFAMQLKETFYLSFRSWLGWKIFSAEHCVKPAAGNPVSFHNCFLAFYEHSNQI